MLRHVSVEDLHFPISAAITLEIKVLGAAARVAFLLVSRPIKSKSASEAEPIIPLFSTVVTLPAKWLCIQLMAF